MTDSRHERVEGDNSARKYYWKFIDVVRYTFIATLIAMIPITIFAVYINHSVSMIMPGYSLLAYLLVAWAVFEFVGMMVDVIYFRGVLP